MVWGLCWRNCYFSCISITSYSCQKDTYWPPFPDEFTGVPVILCTPAEVGGMREAKNLEMLQRLGISSLVNASPDVVHVPGALEKTQVEWFRCRLKSDWSAVEYEL